jgi:hypothetical protein
MADKQQPDASKSGAPNDNPMNLHGKAAEEEDESKENDESTK